MLDVIQIRTNKRIEIIDITSQVENVLRNKKVKEGFCSVYTPHTTSAITINEAADPSVKKDILNYLNKLIPENDNYSHAEGNSDAHIKAALIGSDRNVIIHEGKLLLGTWQGIFFCEFDGPRNRKVYIKFIQE